MLQHGSGRDSASDFSTRRLREQQRLAMVRSALKETVLFTKRAASSVETAWACAIATTMDRWRRIFSCVSCVQVISMVYAASMGPQQHILLMKRRRRFSTRSFRRRRRCVYRGNWHKQKHPQTKKRHLSEGVLIYSTAFSSSTSSTPSMPLNWQGTMVTSR